MTAATAIPPSPSIVSDPADHPNAAPKIPSTGARKMKTMNRIASAFLVGN